ncbi:sugar phosphate isomerase/epimerase family protein [Parageobacillus thermoglucosidasius]|uniref:sugar phosphate isomerase/epimerase family protein n=1 Tax=Parageobacillus thermoglucosidasius TaxID=1426 RepID=UPI0030C6CE4A
MKRWISTWSIGPNDELAHFQKIKEAGFAGVEIWCEHKRALVYLEYARQCGLEIGMHLPFHDLNFATPDITVWNHTEKVLIEWMKKLREYEGVHATLHGGYAWASEERDEAIEKVKKRLTAMAAIAAELGVELLLENLIADRLNYSHHIASHFSEWKSLLDEANVKACLDVGHLLVMKENIEDVIAKLGGLLAAVHYSDNDGASDLHLLPDGKNSAVNGVLETLQQMNFKGPNVYELNPYRYSLQDILHYVSEEKIAICLKNRKV